MRQPVSWPKGVTGAVSFCTIWSGVGPFDRILVTAAAPRVPPPLVEQLRDGGKLVVPEGRRDSQRLVVYHKAAGGLVKETGEVVSFVPLIGCHGWSAGD